MTTKIGKIEVQKSGEGKSKFNFSHDVSSTYGFGEIQPLMVRPCVTGNETHNWTIDSLVRLSPLAVSTFGRVQYKLSNHFVPFDEICPSWKNILSNVPESYFNDNTGTSSIPYKFPTVSQTFLQVLLSTYPYGTYSNSIRPGRNNANSNWEQNPIDADTFYKLNHAFPAAVGSFRSGGIFDATTHFIPYHEVTSDSAYLTPDGADFNIFYVDDEVTDSDHLLLVKLTGKGKRLYKILTGLGYKPSPNTDLQMNMLPLLAFYKAYFDEYCIPQYQNWFDTSAYKLIKYMEMHSPTYSIDAQLQDSNPIVKLVMDFFDDLSECWYSENSDYVSGCTPADGSLPSAMDQRLDQLNYSRMGAMVNALSMFDEVNPGITGEKFNPEGFSSSYSFDQVSDEVLKKIYLSVNRESAVGYDIKKRLIEKGYQSYVDDCESYHLGSKTIPIQISDVNSSADTSTGPTSGTPLGAYTGKGIQYDQNHFKYTNSTLGYIITLGTIVPVSSVVNALDPTLLGINRYTFYNPEFDSLGMEEVARACIGKLQGTYANEISVKDDNLFGYLPRYSGFKCSTSNILNGEFSMKSTRQSWLPYTLDKVIIENGSSQTSDVDAEGKFKTNDTTADAQRWLIPTAGQDWRYPTNASWKGNFNRIFLYGSEGYHSGNNWSMTDFQVDPVSDNFLVHNVIDHTAYISMKPISESWDTIDEEDGGPRITSKV